MVALEDWLVNLVVHNDRVFAQFEIPREPSCGTNSVSFYVPARKLKFSFLTRLVGEHDRAVGPSPNRVRCREEAITLAKSFMPHLFEE